MRFSSLGIFAAALLSVFSGNIFAGDVPEAHQLLISQFDNIEPDDISDSDVPGLLEVNFDGTLLYATEDGRYLIQGDVYDVMKKVNVTEQARALKRAAAVELLDAETMVIFEADDTDTEIRTVTVFTDIDCGYCRKLHREIAEYNAAGIRVQYMFFPRSGPDTASWYKAESVWCAEDRNEALTRSKAGEVLPEADCGSTPVEEHYELGLAVGVSGTPALMTESGVMIAGYMPADQLRERLDMLAKVESAQ